MTSAASLVSLIGRARLWAALQLDLLAWKRGLAQLPSGPGKAVPGRTVLFCDLLASISTQKAQAAFARILHSEGFSPVVLLPTRSWLTERIYNAAGSTRFVYFEDLATETARQEARDLAAQVLADAGAFRRLVELEVDGARTGRNVLSLALRRLRVGELREDDPEHRRIVRDILAESLLVIRVARTLFDTVTIDLAIFCERGYTPAGEIFDSCIARGIDTIQWLGAPQEDRLLFKRYAPTNRASHPLALDPETWARLKAASWSAAQEDRLMDQLRSHYVSGAWFNRQQLQTGKSHLTPSEVRARLGIAEGRKVAGIFCHILYDATFFYGDSLYPNYEAWLVETVRAAIDNPHIDWLVKVHPVNVWRSRMDGQPMEQLEAIALRKAFGELPAHIKLVPADTEINTWSLFETIDYGLTVRGTVGMEMPCFAIPTVTAGSGRYSGFGFTIDPQTPEEFRQVLLTLHERPRLDAETVRLARKYAYGTFFLRPVGIDGIRLDYHANTFNHPLLNQNVCLSVPHGPEGNLHRLVRWMARERSADFLDQMASSS